jgi:hypothetical protein
MFQDREDVCKLDSFSFVAALDQPGTRYASVQVLDLKYRMFRLISDGMPPNTRLVNLIMRQFFHLRQSRVILCKKHDQSISQEPVVFFC